MYAFPEMLKLTKIKWKSKAHKQVAENLLLGNKRITTCDELTRCGNIINAVDKSKIKTLTLGQAAELGIPVN